MKNLTTKLQAQYTSKFGVVHAFPRLTDEEIARYSKQLGRPITPAEAISGSLIRKPGKHFGSDAFRVRMANAVSNDPFEAELASLKEESWNEHLATLTPVNRTIAIVERARDERKAKELQTVEHGKKLEVFSPILEDLDRRLADARFDEGMSYEDVEHLFNCKRQIMEEGGCVVAAQELYADALKAAKLRNEGRRAATVEAASKAQMELARLQAQIDGYDVALGVKPSSQAAQIRAQKAADDAAWQTYLDSDPRVAAYHGDAFTNANLAGKQKIQAEFHAWKAEQETTAAATATAAE